MMGWSMPATMKTYTAAASTRGIPPVSKTAVHRLTVWTIRETSVTVLGVEYCMPRREVTSTQA